MNFWEEGNNFYYQKTKIKQHHLRIYFCHFIAVRYEQNKIIKNAFPAVSRLSFSSFCDEYHISELLTQNPLVWKGCQATARGYVRGKDPAHLRYARCACAHAHTSCGGQRSLCLPLQQEGSGRSGTAREGLGKNRSGFYL